MWILLLIVVLGAVYFVFRSDFFNIESVTVNGNVLTATSTILNQAEIEIGSNMFLLNKALTEKRIETYQFIKHAEVQRHLPSSIEITVQEREAWAQLTVRDKCIIIDDEGFYISDAEYISNESNMLLISLEKDYAEPLNLGQPVCLEAAKIIKTIYQALTPQFCDREISEYYYNTKDGMLTLYTVQGVEIRFGDLERLETKLGYVKKIQETNHKNELEGNEEPMKYIDIRYGVPSLGF